jgi:uncharacterized protein (TIGR02246 family)
MTRSIRAAVFLAPCLACTAAMAVAPPPDLLQSDDELAIRELLVAQVREWNDHDVAAWVQHFAADADFTDWRGSSAHGREAIRNLEAFNFGAAFSSGKLKVVDLQVRFPLRGVATALRQDLLSPVRAADGAGEERHSTLLVLKKESGRWSIEAMQSVRQVAAGDLARAR